MGIDEPHGITVEGTRQREETFAAIANAWDAAAPGTPITVRQPNAAGGKTLEKILLAHFPDAGVAAREKARFITFSKTAYEPASIEEWRAFGRLRLVERTGFYSLPGLFGWDRIDPGSQLLMDHAAGLRGTGADFGCGYGFLSRSVCTLFPAVERLYAIDIDPRAVDACTRNTDGLPVDCRTGDCRRPLEDLPPLDFVITNPPFHTDKGEDRTMGRDFIATAAHHLKKGGRLWLVANRHMPYEEPLRRLFRTVETVHESRGYKIINALK